MQYIPLNEALKAHPIQNKISNHLFQLIVKNVISEIKSRQQSKSTHLLKKNENGTKISLKVTALKASKRFKS